MAGVFTGLVCLALLLATGPAQAAPMSRAQALSGLNRPQPVVRLAAADRLARVGQPADVRRLQPLLADDDAEVREAASAAIWQIWSRSGNAATDALFARGVEQMQSARLEEALATFHQVIRRQPSFAEGWNKRATVYFLLGRFEASLQDCDEVFKRNPDHFGALSGAGQIHLRLGNWQNALDFFRRALAVNPNLTGLIPVIEQLERQALDRSRGTT